MNVAKRKPLEGVKRKEFIFFVENYAEKIVEKWIDYFVYHKNLSIERISKK